MNVNILIDHLANWIIIAHLRWNQIISRLNAHIWLLRIQVTLHEHSQSSTVAGHDETALAGSTGFALSCSGSTGALRRLTTECCHRVDGEEFLSWVTDREALVFTTGIEQVDLAVVIANDKASIIFEPSMASIVVRVVLLGLSLVDEDWLDFHSSSIKLDKAVKLDASNNDNAWVNCAE